MHGPLICVHYSDLEQYSATFPPTRCFTNKLTPISIQHQDSAHNPLPELDKTSPSISPRTIPANQPSHPSTFSLTYAFISLFGTCAFNFMTPSDNQSHKIRYLASNFVYQCANAWRKIIMDSENVKEVRIWCRENCLDIVLKLESE
jgi:hypothetical protein